MTRRAGNKYRMGPYFKMEKTTPMINNVTSLSNSYIAPIDHFTDAVFMQNVTFTINWNPKESLSCCSGPTMKLKKRNIITDKIQFYFLSLDSPLSLSAIPK